MAETSLGAHYLETVTREFRSLKRLGEKALAQVDDSDLHATLDAESNSLAVLMRHVAGNMRSRWTDFLTADGEKPDRNRDGEFVAVDRMNRAALMEEWELGWKCLFDALAPLTADDLMRTVMIRGESHTVVQAIERQVAHYADHIGQMVFLAKHLKHTSWKSLSIPRGKSEEFRSSPRPKP